MIAKDFQDQKRRWESWITKHPDMFESVHRGKDMKQLEIGVKDVVQKLSLKRGDKLLDAGCGSAIFLSEIIKYAHVDAIGIDFSVSHIKFAADHFSHTRFLVANIEKLPFRSFSFDKILTYSVIHCLMSWENTLDEFLRVLKPGGKILLGDVPSLRHKYRMYLDSFKGLCFSIKNLKKLKEKWFYLKDEIPWDWVDLDKLRNFVEKRGVSCKILPQPRHRQFESITYHYRFDVLIEK